MRYLMLIFLILSSASAFSQMDDKGAIKIAFEYDTVQGNFEDIITIKYILEEEKQTFSDTFLLKDGVKIPHRLF